MNNIKNKIVFFYYRFNVIDYWDRLLLLTVIVLFIDGLYLCQEITIAR